MVCVVQPDTDEVGDAGNGYRRGSFSAAGQVTPTGKVFGIDLASDLLVQARQNVSRVEQ